LFESFWLPSLLSVSFFFFFALSRYEWVHWQSGPILFSFDCYEIWGHQRYSYPHGLLKIFLKMTRKVLFAVCVVSQEPHAICMLIAWKCTNSSTRGPSTTKSMDIGSMGKVYVQKKFGKKFWVLGVHLARCCAWSVHSYIGGYVLKYVVKYIVVILCYL
jgi:hypothetical protein